jgi:hypothetical protein
MGNGHSIPASKMPGPEVNHKPVSMALTPLTFSNSMGIRVSQFSVVARIADGRPENQSKTFVRCIEFCLLHTAHTYTEVCPASCLLSVWGSVFWREVAVERSSRMYILRACSTVSETDRFEILASRSRGFL